jgi:hypothetical protein
VKPKPKPSIGAGAREAMRELVEELPFGVVGEYAVPQPPMAPPAMPQRFVPPPPPWSPNYRPELDPDYQPPEAES